MVYKIDLYNFMSFKGLTEIDFRKTNYKFFEDTHTQNGIIKSAVFAGGNATGKTNVLKALQFLNTIITDKMDFSKNIKCMLIDETYYYLKFYLNINNKDVVYYLKVDVESKLLEENLSIDNCLIFERKGTTSELFEHSKVVRVFDDVPKDILFLKNHYYNTKFDNNDDIIKLYDFVENMIFIDQANKSYITKKEVRESLYTIDDTFDGVINGFLEKVNYNFRIRAIKEELTDTWRVAFKRIGVDFEIDSKNESTGNRTLLNLLLPFIYAIKNSSILIIDEFSSSFHNDLEELLINYFIENSTGAQLFFTTHSTNILSNKLLRPDQMYAVDFDVQKGSFIKRFSDEQPRMSQNTEKMFESGVFGGKPQYDKNK